MFRVPTPKPGDTVLIIGADYDPTRPTDPVPATVTAIEQYPARIRVEAQHGRTRVAATLDHLSVADLSKPSWTWGSRPAA